MDKPVQRPTAPSLPTEKDLPAYVEDYMPETEEKPQITADELVTDTSIERVALRVFPGGVDPEIVEVKQGSKVYFTVTSMAGDVSIAIPDFGINQMFKKEQAETISFNADTKGEFEFFCTSNCEGNMEGRIIVN